jgi:hypothetical protein
MQGIKHLVNCTCFLPHLKGGGDTVFHSFVVFSQINDEGEVLEKLAQCNNCGVVHRVFDVCKSEITKKENHGAVITEKDIALSLPSDLSGILASYSCDIATWEQVHFIFSNGMWGERAILTREEEKGTWSGKMLTVAGPTQFKIEPYGFSEVTS